MGETAVKVAGHKNRSVNDVMALFGVNDVMALETCPLYERLRTEAPVYWDPYLHALLVTGYADLVTVLHHFSAGDCYRRNDGLPTSDANQLKDWSADFAEVQGNFQHNPDRSSRILKCVEEMTAYFRDTQSNPNGTTRGPHQRDAFNEKVVASCESSPRMSVLAILIRGRRHRRRVPTAAAAVFPMAAMPAISAVTAHVSAHVLIHFHGRAAI
jgi:hypothetical protein